MPVRLQPVRRAARRPRCSQSAACGSASSTTRCSRGRARHCRAAAGSARDERAASCRRTAGGTSSSRTSGARVAVASNPVAAQPLKRRKISEPLVPPKPKEFDSATSICIAPRGVGHVVQIAVRIGRAVVDGRRRDVVADGEHREDRLDHPGGAQQVPGHRLGGAHRDLAWRDRRRRASWRRSRPCRPAASRSRAR